MDSDKWKKIERICYKARQLEGKKQHTYIKNACAGDDDLLDEIHSLLEQQDQQRLKEPLVQMQSSFVFSDEESVSKQTIGPYRIIRTIASGGMGNVYLAVRNDDQFERFVALKVIRKELVSDEVLNRFYEERQILASLNHPNIARLFDGGTTDDGMPWFAMEYIEGKPIIEYCQLHDLGIEEKIDLFQEVCSAVQYAHQNLVIHQDLKPKNILISPEGTPKLLDFGIAKLMSLEQNADPDRFQNKLMTPEYASPEQVRGRAVSTVSDVYSLGVLLYELHTGKLPYQFKEREAASIEQTICSTIPPPPSEVSDPNKLKKDLDQIIMKALHKDPAERYTSVEQLANELKRYQLDLPVLAQDDSFPYRATKFLKRHKWSTAVSVGIAFLIMAFAIVTYIQSQTIKARAIEAERQRDRAEQVSTFLTDLFESVDPNKAEDQSLSAIELLHRGANRVETELKNQPRQQANVYLVISDVYESLGLFDKSLDLAQKAYALQQELFDRNHPQVARSLNAMGWLYRQKGQYKKADSLLTKGLAMRQQLFGLEHLKVARSLNDLAVLKQSRADYAATDTLLQQAIEIRKALAGAKDKSVGTTLSNYAALKYRMGDLPAAEEKLREALQIFQSDVGNKDMRTANVMTNLAAVLLSQGELDRAEPLYRKALDIRIKLLGRTHPDVASSYAHLGNLLVYKKQFEEAEGQLLRALELRKNSLGKHHVLVGVNKRVLGDLYQKMGAYSEAEKYLTGAVKTFRTKYPDGHSRTAETLQLLGEVYMETDDPTHAEHQFQRALNIRLFNFDKTDPRTIETQLALGRCLTKLEKFSEAELYLKKSHTAAQKTKDQNPKLSRRAEQALIKLYENWGYPTKADAYRTKTK
ncbi:serine/threonine-protein kinase [Fodinibius halophilus]|nr:serine/threonine-protein kinase [Fodinibius halophilus]